jgi:protein AATF/BFR2
VRTTRKQILEASEEDPDAGDGFGEQDDEENAGELERHEPGEDLPSQSVQADDHTSSQSEQEEESEAEHSDGHEPGPQPAENLTFTLRKKRDEDRIKGKAISCQLVRVPTCKRYCILILYCQAIWDALLDARIRLQKSVVAANRLPAVRLRCSIGLPVTLHCLSALGPLRIHGCSGMPGNP